MVIQTAQKSLVVMAIQFAVISLNEKEIINFYLNLIYILFKKTSLMSVVHALLILIVGRIIVQINFAVMFN